MIQGGTDVIVEIACTRNVMYLTAHAAQYQKNNAIKKWVEDLNRHISKEDIQMTNKQISRCSTSLIIREMEIKIIIRYHFTLIRMAVIKISTNNKCWRKGNPLALLAGM